LPEDQIEQSYQSRLAVIPDSHCPVMTQVVALDDRFGTHNLGLYLNPPDKAVVLCMDDGSPSSKRKINNETLH
jgi:hypothetical protein